MTVTLSHKIELKANSKFKTYCRKAFGVSRFTWNWVLERVNDKRERKEKIDVLELKKEFNHIKRRQYPFVMEVTKYASLMTSKATNPLLNGKAFRSLKRRDTARDRFISAETWSS